MKDDEAADMLCSFLWTAVAYRLAGFDCMNEGYDVPESYLLEPSQGVINVIGEVA